MARKISGPSADAEMLEWALRIAETQVDINRVRNSRIRLVAQFLVDPNFQPRQVHRQRLRLLKMVLAGDSSRAPPIEMNQGEEMFNPKVPEGEVKLSIILEERISELAALDRYERRALSRRKAAIRNFDAARASARPDRVKFTGKPKQSE